MATVTKRSVAKAIKSASERGVTVTGRSVAKAIKSATTAELKGKRKGKQGKGKGTLSAKAIRERKNAIALQLVQTDKRIENAFKDYEASEAKPSNLMQLMDKVVRTFAASADYIVTTDVLKNLAARELKARSEARRDKKFKMTARDKAGVAASEFASVLKLSKMPGGVAMWKRIIDIAGNWTFCKRISTDVRNYHKAHGEFPNASIFEKIATSHTKASKRTGKAKPKARTLVNRLVADIKVLQSYARKLGVEPAVQGLKNHIARINEVLTRAEKAEELAAAAA